MSCGHMASLHAAGHSMIIDNPCIKASNKTIVNLYLTVNTE